MADEIRNVFMSHVHEDDAALDRLKGLAAKQNLEVRDGSVSSDNPNRATNSDYIKSEILAPRIRWASVLVVLISPLTHTSPWVNWEIEYAQRLGKRIVGVWLRGAQNADLPDALEKYHDTLVGWNSERVVDAITGRHNEWVDSTGQPRPMREITRHDC